MKGVSVKKEEHTDKRKHLKKQEASQESEHKDAISEDEDLFWSKQNVLK